MPGTGTERRTRFRSSSLRAPWVITLTPTSQYTGREFPAPRPVNHPSFRKIRPCTRQGAGARFPPAPVDLRPGRTVCRGPAKIQKQKSRRSPESDMCSAACRCPVVSIEFFSYIHPVRFRLPTHRGQTHTSI